MSATELFVYALIGAFFSALITAVILKFLIPFLKSKKLGQKILDIGPRWHKSKEGTPTMGGLAFLVAFVVAFFALIIINFKTNDVMLGAVIVSALYALLNGLIGIIDDSTKFLHHENEGLKAWEKYLLQLIAACVYVYAMYSGGYISTNLYIPYLCKTINLGYFYFVLIIILLTGIVNSVNLNDGIDGLTSSITMIVAAFFCLCGVLKGMYGVSVISGVMFGCCAGFLVYNFHPAKVFMGDTGSLFLGGLVGGIALCLGNPLIVILCGIMYIIETISVIIQVLCFKLTGKRVFKMAPIHHHFEKCGWSENKIVFVFSFVTVICCIISYFGM